MKVIIKVKCVLPQQSTSIQPYISIVLCICYPFQLDTYVGLYGSHFLLRLDLDHTSDIGKLSLLVLYVNHLGILDSISIQ